MNQRRREAKRKRAQQHTQDQHARKLAGHEPVHKRKQLKKKKVKTTDTSKTGD